MNNGAACPPSWALSARAGDASRARCAARTADVGHPQRLCHNLGCVLPRTIRLVILFRCVVVVVGFCTGLRALAHRACLRSLVTASSISCSSRSRIITGCFLLVSYPLCVASPSSSALGRSNGSERAIVPLPRAIDLCYRRLFQAYASKIRFFV